MCTSRRGLRLQLRAWNATRHGSYTAAKVSGTTDRHNPWCCIKNKFCYSTLKGVIWYLMWLGTPTMSTCSSLVTLLSINCHAGDNKTHSTISYTICDVCIKSYLLGAFVLSSIQFWYDPSGCVAPPFLVPGTGRQIRTNRSFPRNYRRNKPPLAPLCYAA